MPIADLISGSKTPMQQFLDQLQQGKENKNKSDELAETKRYHSGYLENEKQKLEFLKQTEPLKLDLLRERIAAAKRQGNNNLTKATVTNNQKVIQNIDNLIPQIEDLTSKEEPGQTLEKYWSFNEQPAYDAKIAKLTDTLIGALGLPKTDQSVKLAESMVRRKKFENHEAYIKRLADLRDELKGRKQRAVNILGSSNGFGADDSGSGSEDDGAPEEELNYNLGSGDFE